ncbi:hypothetical protein DXZ75_08775 [Streptomyces sp. AcE210]|nr:hypothetical protein DXZ75_08775 [Streptomyces sp. AcE210]
MRTAVQLLPLPTVAFAGNEHGLLLSHETRQSLENDGHRTVMWRDAESVRLQARSGRRITSV